MLRPGKKGVSNTSKGVVRFYRSRGVRNWDQENPTASDESSMTKAGSHSVSKAPQQWENSC